MNRYILTILFNVVLMLNYSVAQEVPILDLTTVETPKAKTLNKCIGKGNDVIYTQFECQSNTQKVEENWAENANLTYLTPNKVLSTTDIVSSILGNNKLNNNNYNQNKNDQSGMSMLKDAMKDKSLLEMFDNGVKALIIRQEILNSL